MGKNLLNSIKLTKPKKNAFDLTHDVKLSLNMGDLVPTLAMECVPGDKVNIACESVLRLSPLVAPMMHRCDVYMHYFFVPNRILWDNWENYITNTPVDGVNLPAFPFIRVDDGNYGKLHDYLGIPNPTTVVYDQPEDINALPFAAYNKIFNEYYRDQNLIDAVEAKCVDGDNTSNLNLKLLQRCWEHDYFTASLPFAQKGQPVTLPIGQFEDVPVYINQGVGNTLTGTPNNVLVPGEISENTDIPFNRLYADTSEMETQSATINDLRRAFRLQEWLEKAARGGSRYVENILNHFGVKSSDARLQRPEYITGAKTPIVISEVLNTTGTDTAPQGNMAGHGVGVTSGRFGSYFCEEHGYIIGIMSVMPKTAYFQGLDKHWLKIKDPFEFFWPSFAHIGEQEVENREVYAFQSDGGSTFGYVPRYAEYKFMSNRVAGDFRKSLDFWHMARKFDNKPQLNADFVSADPTRRVFAVTDQDVDSLYCQVLHKIMAVRPMPKFGTPMM